MLSQSGSFTAKEHEASSQLRASLSVVSLLINDSPFWSCLDSLTIDSHIVTQTQNHVKMQHSGNILVREARIDRLRCGAGALARSPDHGRWWCSDHAHEGKQCVCKKGYLHR
jgi:hypothetical protein